MTDSAKVCYEDHKMRANILNLFFSVKPTTANTHGWIFPKGVKWPEREMHHSSPHSFELKNEWDSTSTPSCSFMAWTGTALPLPSFLFGRTFKANFYSVVSSSETQSTADDDINNMHNATELHF
jgi:hypothetical protein